MSKSAEIPIGSKKYRPFLQLGLGLAAKYGVGSKAALLDVAARNGLPVPPGLILLDVAYQDALREGYIDAEESDGRTRLICRRPERLIAVLNLPNFTWEFPGPFAIRPAFAPEHEPYEREAGAPTFKLNVDPRDSEALARALLEVWEAAAGLPDSVRRDLLIMRMVAAQREGMAYTEGEYEDDWVTLSAGPDSERESGGFGLPRLRAGEERLPGVEVEAWQGRVQRLLRDTRRQFSHRKTGTDWEIAWADDGEKCYLLRMRPITQSRRRDERFAIIDHVDGLLPLPTRFTASLIASCAAEVYAGYRALDERLPVRRRLIATSAGRPYLNRALLIETMRHLGLPSRLMTETIGGADERQYPRNPRRMARKCLVLLRLGLKRLRAAGEAERIRAGALKRAAQPGATLSETIDTMRWLYARLAEQSFGLPVLILSMGQRARLCDDLKRGIEGTRDALLALAEGASNHGMLPDPAAVWLLEIEEVRRLDEGWRPDAAFWEERRAEEARWRAHTPLEVIRQNTRPDKGT